MGHTSSSAKFKRVYSLPLLVDAKSFHNFDAETKDYRKELFMNGYIHEVVDIHWNLVVAPELIKIVANFYGNIAGDECLFNPKYFKIENKQIMKISDDRWQTVFFDS